MNATPAVSILMPCRNAAATLPRALESIRRQTLEDWELLAVDDGSRDASTAILRQAARDDQRIRVFTLAEHGGLVRALNLGLEQVRGGFVARMDADDEMLPERLQQQWRHLTEHQETGLVSCLVRHGGDGEEQAGYRRHVEWLNRLRSHEEMSMHRFVDAPVAHPTVMFRRELVEQLGGYREGPFPEDFELWLRWLEGGVRIEKAGQELMVWHDPPDRLSRTDRRYSPAAFAAIRAPYLARWLRAHNPHHPDVWVWGAGRVSRRSLEPLSSEGVKVTAWVDVDAKKRTSRGRDGLAVVGPEDLPGPGQVFVLANVGALGASEKIARFLTDRGWRSGIDWLPLA